MLTYRSGTIQRVRDLISDRRAREREGVFVVEGVVAIRDALALGAQIESLFVSERTKELASEVSDSVVVEVLDDSVMSRVSATKTSAGALAVMRRVNVELDTLVDAQSVVVCVGVSDPGNAGTIIRTVAAAGFDGVIFASDSVDVFNPKVVRASAAALFSTKVVVNVSLESVMAWCAKSGVTAVATSSHAKNSIWDTEWPQRVALLVGNEAHGLSDSSADLTVSIPIADGVESLNVATATAVLCFEIAKNRTPESGVRSLGRAPREGEHG